MAMSYSLFLKLLSRTYSQIYLFLSFITVFWLKLVALSFKVSRGDYKIFIFGIFLLEIAGREEGGRGLELLYRKERPLRTFAPITTAHRYCARKFTRHHNLVPRALVTLVQRNGKTKYSGKIRFE